MGDAVLEVAVQEEACGADRHAALERFEAIRRETEALTANLTPEDQSIQSMPDVSPTKWHLGHTTWFFETFLLARFDPDYRVFDPAFGYLFNSYYEAVGPRHPRPERGLLSRPTVDIVTAYRDHVSAAMARLIERVAEPEWSEVAPLLELGIHHEQQHQELILMDIKHVFSLNPLLPAYQAPQLQVQATAQPLAWVEFAGGLKEIGHSGAGFAFDNETPAAQGLARTVSPRCAAGDLRRISRLHRGRRLQQAGILAVRRLGDGPRAGLGSAALLASRRRASGRSLRCPAAAG